MVSPCEGGGVVALGWDACPEWQLNKVAQGVLTGYGPSVT